ncbi:MAG TPA: FtsX-like permease family protein [Xanthobacteraceae bacterium]|nr:FtsX-like permease family protein [Xanthobacteraceae bacterium]
MTISAPAQSSGAPKFLPLRFALREMRGGLSGFYVFIACLALGVMAIAGVGSVSGSLNDGLAREGRVIVGGDISFNLIQREASSGERAFIAQRGRLSVAATMRAMTQTGDGRSALVELKAVDRAYPLYGALSLEPALDLTALLAERDGVFGAAAAPALLTRLGLQTGDRVSVGAANLEIRAALRSEPDKLAGGIDFGPRLLISEEALRATGLLQPGSLVRWRYRLRLPESDASEQASKTIIDAAQAQLPDAGWEIRSRSNASPQLARNVERFTQYLTLVGLTALLVGGVGVANAVKSHLDRKREVIATMKAVGATGTRVFAVYLSQVLVLALIGAAIGLAIGAALPFLIDWAFGSIIPLPIEPAIYPAQLVLALIYGLLTACAFALWPLGRAHDVPVSALFRDEVARQSRWPRRRYMAATAAVAVMLAGAAVFLAYDRRIALIFIGAAAVVFVVLRLVAEALMWAARHTPHKGSALVRLAIANIHRPGALTPTVVLSLGLGLALLMTLVQIDGNLRRQFTAALPDKAPSFYFTDIPALEAERFDAFIRSAAPGAALERVPMLRGRIVSANGVKAEDLKPTPDAAWVLQSDRGLTYAGEVPAGSRVVEGQWWGPDYKGPPLVSFEKKLAEGLGLKLGDPVTVNVLGRPITAHIANMRSVDWESLGINFVLVYSPGAFAGAPHTHIATLTYPDGSNVEQEDKLLKAAAEAFPMVTTVPVKEAIEAVAKVVANLALGIRGASLVSLVAAVLVLGGALAAGRRNRVYDAVILKTLGATRARLLGAYGLEYLVLGLATAVFGVAAGSIAAWLVVTKVMNLSFVWLPGSAAAAAAGALIVTVALGLIGTFSALSQKPAPVLRNL